MPEIKEGESEADYVKRCIPIRIAEGDAPDRAAAACHGMYKQHKEKKTQYQSYSFSVPMITKNIEVTNAEPTQIVDPHASPGKQRAVAIVGDRFYHGQFFPAAELEKAYAGWENTLHDINHMGTMHFQGMTATSDILYFVGYNKNVSYDIESKSMSMDIHIKEDTMYGKAWQAYIDLCEEAGQIPNVSIHFMAESKAVQVKDLPKGVNYAEYGLKDTDYVKYIYNIQPRALSTVFRGVCNDSQGCGIGKCSCSENDTDTDTQTVDQNNTEKMQTLIKRYEAALKEAEKYSKKGE